MAWGWPGATHDRSKVSPSTAEGEEASILSAGAAPAAARRGERAPQSLEWATPFPQQAWGTEGQKSSGGGLTVGGTLAVLDGDHQHGLLGGSSAADAADVLAGVG